ncbi:MAG: hypothetical protein DRI01_00530 [Chloroflexi bacterium]|nr:MAG: hypothetical protein DRI01_00530 [Chloroflexota bacterium]
MADYRRNFLQLATIEYCDAERHNRQTNLSLVLTTAPVAKAAEPIATYDVVYISSSNYYDSTVSSGGTSKQEFVDTNLTGSNDYWNGSYVFMDGSGESNEDEIGFVSDWVEGTNTVTLEEKMTATIDTGDDYVISLTEVKKANASSYDSQKVYGMAMNKAATDEVVDIRAYGVVINPAWNWSGAGKYVYLSDTDGQITATPNQYGVTVGRILSEVSIFIDPNLQSLCPVKSFYPEFTDTILYGPASDPYGEFGASQEGDWSTYGRSYYYWQPTSGHRAATDEYYLTTLFTPPEGFEELHKFEFEHRDNYGSSGSYGIRAYLVTDLGATHDSGWQASTGWETYDSGALNYSVTPGARQQLSFKFHGSASDDNVRLSSFKVYWR